jgi:hypothetical protein
MSFEAEYFQSSNIFQRETSAGWTWPIAGRDHFWYQNVVPSQANQTVEVTRRAVVTDNDLNVHVEMDVTLTPAPGLVNFVGIRIPA